MSGRKTKGEMPIMAALLEVDELRFEIDDDVCAAKDVWGVEV